MERNEIKMNEIEKQAVKLIKEKETLNNLDTELGRYLIYCLLSIISLIFILIISISFFKKNILFIIICTIILAIILPYIPKIFKKIKLNFNKEYRLAKKIIKKYYMKKKLIDIIYQESRRECKKEN